MAQRRLRAALLAAMTLAAMALAGCGTAASTGGSTTLLAVVPIAIVFMLSQRSLVRGLVGGAVKE